jgi:hypothetical protein
MSIKPSVSALISSQVPEFVREDNPTFVAFLQAYYDYIQTQSPDLRDLRNLDTTLDGFIKHFKNELATNLPPTIVDQRFLLQHIKDQYLAKGSESSYKLLFRMFFNKEVSIDYPAKQMLRASDGKWNQDVSIIAKVTSGHPDDIVGKLVDVITPTKIVRLMIDRRQYIEIEVERVVLIAPDIYEFYIDRRFFGNININDKLRYKTENTYFSATILATTSKLQVLSQGTGFKVGQLYNIRNGQGTGSIMKVTAVTSVGGIVSAEFIKYGVGYTTDFSSTIYADSGQTVAGTGGTSLQVIGGNLSIGEGTDGFEEVGYINKSDYAVGSAIDGTYAGQILREFGNSAAAIESPYDPAVIKISLGPLAKYPGYYINNDGFLDDAIFIQDSRYYQAFSYVIKIDERLDTYKSLVKTLLHPAGMAVFGEYNVKNEFDIGIELESMIKILAVSTRDNVLITSSNPVILLTKGFEDSYSVNNEFISTKEFGKALEDSIDTPPDSISTIRFGKALSDSIVTPPDSISTIGFGKALADFPSMGEAITAKEFGKALADLPVVTEIPLLSVTKYINNTESGDDVITPVDSGGYMILNPYGEAGWFLETYVGSPINF